MIENGKETAMETRNDLCRYEGTAIVPWHEVRDEEKVRMIAESMQVNGWTGEPILLVRYGDGYKALTGMHRLAAANLARIDPVCHVLEQDIDIEPDGESIRDTEDLLRLFERNCSDPEALRILRVEADKE